LDRDNSYHRNDISRKRGHTGRCRVPAQRRGGCLPRTGHVVDDGGGARAFARLRGVPDEPVLEDSGVQPAAHRMLWLLSARPDSPRTGTKTTISETASTSGS